MNFDRSVYCNWSYEKHQKWKEWNKQFSDDDIVIEGAKSKSFENTAFLIAPISMSIVIFSMIFIIDYINNLMTCFFIGVIANIVLFFIINHIIYLYYKSRGMKNYHVRVELFRAGIKSLSIKFHNKGVAKHKAIQQKQYEEYRRLNKK